MKAIRIHSYGHSDQMKLEEAPRPAIKSHQALVRIRAAGVNPVDWKIREGYLKDALHASFPLTLGQDFAGDIVEAGNGILDFKVGDKVFGFAPGSYAEFATLGAKDLVHMPTTVDYAGAAALPTAGLTAYQIMMDVIQASKDQKILIHGAAGGVGSIAVQLARTKEARIFATASASDAEYLKSLGVERVVDYRSERFEEIFKDLDAVIDLIGGDTLARSYQVLRKGGDLVSSVAAPDEGELRTRGLKGKRFLMKKDPTQLARLGTMVDQGILAVKVGQVLPLSDAPRAHELGETGRSRGKIVLRVA